MRLDRLSTYLLLYGVRDPRAWVVLGLGWLGVIWERSTGSRICRTFDRSCIGVNNVVYHLTPLALGLYRLRRRA